MYIGDPIYEDELISGGGGFEANAVNITLVVFGLIAVQFFGVLFFQ
jgi:hypothetical protein